MSNPRDTGLRPRFIFVDGWAFPLLIFALMFVWASIWTRLGLFVASVVVLWICEAKGLTIASGRRAVRSWLAGPIRSAVPYWKKNRRIDHG